MTTSFLDYVPNSIQHLSPYQSGKSIDEVAALQANTPVIKLASNENPLGPSPKAIAAITPQLLASSHRYPDSRGLTLKSALSEHLSVTSEQLVLGNGSDELFTLLAQCFASKHRPIYYSEYGFCAYPITASAMNVPSYAIPAIDYGLDSQALIAKANLQPGLIFIANPNNPTGSVLTHNELETLLAALDKKNIVAIDEAYFDFMHHMHDYPNTLSLQQDYPNLVILRTFSKAYGLAGLRLGYAIAGSEITALINRVRKPFNVSTVALTAATAALDDSAHLKKSLAVIAKGRECLSTAFDELGLDYLPVHGNFITTHFGQQALPLFAALLTKGVILRPLVPYNMSDYLRISIGTHAENLQLIHALKELL